MRRIGVEGWVLVVAILVSWVVPKPTGGFALLAAIAIILARRWWRGELASRRGENLALVTVMVLFGGYLVVLIR